MGGLSPAVTGTDDGLLQSAGNCSPPDQEPGRIQPLLSKHCS